VEVTEQTETVEATVEVTEQTETVVQETVEVTEEATVEVTEQTETVVAEVTETVVQTEVKTEVRSQVVKEVRREVISRGLVEMAPEVKTSLPRECVVNDAGVPESGIFVYRFDSNVAESLRFASENDEVVRLQSLDYENENLSSTKGRDELPVIVEVAEGSSAIRNAVPEEMELEKSPAVIPSAMLRDFAIASEDSVAVKMNEEEASILVEPKATNATVHSSELKEEARSSDASIEVTGVASSATEFTSQADQATGDERLPEKDLVGEKSAIDVDTGKFY
jgi:hypothetical protein